MNGKIAFSSNRAGGSSIDAYLSNADGSGQVQVPNTHSDTDTTNPAWSPGGSRIAFETEFFQEPENYFFEINTINPNGTGKEIVRSFDSDLTAAPAWSGDGAKLVFTDTAILAEGNSSTFLRTVNRDGSGDTIVPGTDRFGFAHTDPAWSPDNSEIALQYRGCVPNTSNCNNGDIFVVRPNGTGRTQLTSDPANDAAPNWSPDGGRIVFASSRDGNSEIYVMNADGSGQTRLTTNAALDLNPVWSPDGNRIAFQSRRDGNDEIYVMNPDGSGQTNVTNNPSVDVDPDWQPLRGLDPFPRPGGGTPLIAYLVPAFEQCTSPNSQHVAPLAEGSCTPPIQESNLLTTSKIGQMLGYVRLDVQVGNPAPTADEADVRIEAYVSDVRNASDQSDYSGQVLVSSKLRITDRASGFGGVSGTVSDFRFDLPVSCTPTAVAPRGADCQILTSADTLVPGMVPEGKRSVVSTFNFTVLDAGLDGEVTPASGCPPTCGTGDEQRYLEQGTFAP